MQWLIFVLSVSGSSVASDWEMLPSEEGDSVLSLDGSVHLYEPVKISPFSAMPPGESLSGEDAGEDEINTLVSAASGAFFVEDAVLAAEEPNEEAAEEEKTASGEEVKVMPLTEENLAALALQESARPAPQVEKLNWPEVPKPESPPLVEELSDDGRPMVPEDAPKSSEQAIFSQRPSTRFFLLPASRFRLAEALAPIPEESASLTRPEIPVEEADERRRATLDNLVYGGVTVVFVTAVAASVLATMRK